MKFDCKAFEELPDNLFSSSYIDFLLLLSKLKPSMRIKISGHDLKINLIDWCERNRFRYLPDSDDYFLIAKNERILCQLHSIDNSVMPHEYRLGVLLGYPKCCSKKISIVGEPNIDKYENNIITKQKFEGDFKLINPVGYKQGYALLSHLPCNPRCQESLSIALKVLSIISQNRGKNHFENWDTIWKTNSEQKKNNNLAENRL